MKVNTCAHETSLEGLVGREGEGFLGAAIACEASQEGILRACRGVTLSALL